MFPYNKYIELNLGKEISYLCGREPHGLGKIFMKQILFCLHEL
jgi:hypothetical protein